MPMSTPYDAPFVVQIRPNNHMIEARLTMNPLRRVEPANQFEPMVIASISGGLCELDKTIHDEFMALAQKAAVVLMKAVVPHAKTIHAELRDPVTKRKV